MYTTSTLSKMNQILESINNVVIRREQRGSTVCNICRYLDYLANDVWANNKAMCAEILHIKKTYQKQG